MPALRVFASLTLLLRLSYHIFSGVFAAFRVSLSRMSGWRDVQAQAQQAQNARHGQPVRVLRVDGAYVRG